MMGWFMGVGIALFAVAVLVFTGFPRRLWMVAATALTLAATGYVIQGSPGVEGHPVTHEEAKVELDPDLLKLRDAMFGNFAFSNPDFGAADAMLRNNAPDEAATVLLAGVKRVPQNAAVWTWLGVTLADRDDGMVSPSSRFAFERAMAVAPKHPGPPYFLGFALIRSGHLAEGRPYWARAVELTPPTLAYRPALVAQLARLDAYLQAQGAQPAPATPPQE